VLAQDAVPVKKKAQLHEPLVNEGKRVEERAEQRSANAMASLKNDVDGELLETFGALTHLINFEFRISNFEFEEGVRRDCRRR
jgi:hypothetical protein